MSAAMRAAWSAFATDGDPGWPAYAVEERLVQCFDDPPVVVPDPERASRAIWQDRGFDALDLVKR
jgi:para-nitrobenzyl esterase